MTDPLARHFPQLAASLPRRRLGSLPVPVERLPSLAAELGAGQLMVKRDDLSGDAYGGNKVRKLEYLLGDALARACNAVMTFGAVGSNHLLATAVYARQCGLRCYGVVTPQPPAPAVAAKLRYHALLGTELVLAEGMRGVEDCAAALLAAHPGGPSRVYRIPWGGSSWLGAVGFVAAALELAQQLTEPPDYIYLANGTMGTSVGLAIGCRLLRWPTRIVAVRVAPFPLNNEEILERLFQSTIAELVRRDPSFPALEDPWVNIGLRDEFLGDGYAIPTPGALEAIELLRERAGLTLDETYTGKAMAALIADARAGRLAGRRTLFWHSYSSRPFPDELAQAAVERLPAALQPYLAADTTQR